MQRFWIVLAGALWIASASVAATLTITPDKQVYQVGELITLNVFGDSGGESDNAIWGRIRFDSGLAVYVSSSQEPLTWLGIPIWIPGPLGGGVGFGDAFSQISGEPGFADVPLSARVVLTATTQGTLSYSWQTTGQPLVLDFFGLTSAPGGSVTIVPEPASGVLMVLGLLGLARRRRAD